MPQPTSLGDYADFYRQSIAPDTREAFWLEQARAIDWHQAPQQACDYHNPPFARWFADGQLNLCHNAVDRHLAQRADQPAIIAVSTETNTERVYTFAQLHEEVQRMAAVLQSFGVGKGDRVQIYMPMIAEAAFAMLACVRLGAIHSVVFGGFASVSLASRIDDAQPKVVISADAGSRGGKAIAYKPLLDKPCSLPSTNQRRCCWSIAAWPPCRCRTGAIIYGALCARSHSFQRQKCPVHG